MYKIREELELFFTGWCREVLSRIFCVTNPGLLCARTPAFGVWCASVVVAVNSNGLEERRGRS